MPTVLYEDNAACIAQLKGGYMKGDRTKHISPKSCIAQLKGGFMKGDRTKHISPKFFFTHDLQKNGNINVQQIRSSDNLVDLFTKPKQCIDTFTPNDALFGARSKAICLGRVSASRPRPRLHASGHIPCACYASTRCLPTFLWHLMLSSKKKKKKRLEYDYYTEQSPGNNGGNFYNASTPQRPANNWQNGNQFKADKMGNLPPPPGTHGAWQTPSPPPPPPPGPQPPHSPGAVVSGSDMSSNFSGPHGPALPPPHPSVALGFTQSSFSYEELAAATSGFSQANLLGQGGFGYVHKGVLPTGKEIAVKSLKAGSGQGDREFQAEVEIISRVHHRYLVSLVGYCIAGGQRLLVYEFLPNSTLEYHLYGRGLPTMDWSTRIKIAMGSAKGLAYLHEDCHPRIIHRDIKAANILLDHNFEAKVADFGLAKLSSDNYTHVSTRVMGTFGYLAPEYASSGKLTEKSDARPLCASAVDSRNFVELADPRLEGNYDPAEMARMWISIYLEINDLNLTVPSLLRIFVTSAKFEKVILANKYVQMKQIVRALEGDVSLEQLNEGVKPGQSTLFSSSSSEYDNSSYSADMKKFRKVVMENNSQEYPSSEYGHTSEYGLNPSSSSSEELDKSTEIQERRRIP
ncbi:hypothetical protein GH714_008778 [Hevea brasiliensis]|uniref:non-specific serine/threonine protein kinase n=1 Tax=Hevea brasiliensis TaxID=3981 RepID=A0A6A6LWR9_HEVBR|nr:hypothetical protein GH714_008778 [Hevea brasiliensis]